MNEYKNLIKKIDDKWQEILDSLKKDGVSLQCKAGCNSCCQKDLSVTFIEKKSIENYILENNINSTTRRDHNKCDFLLENGLCAIYEVRPIICRTHGMPVLVTPEENNNTPTISICELNEVNNLNELYAKKKKCFYNLDLLNTILFAINRMACITNEAALARYLLNYEAIMSNDSSNSKNNGNFFLVPFIGEQNESLRLKLPKISGSLSINNMRENGILISISYNLDYKNYDQKIVFPKLSNNPTRKDFLWETTCFELFLKLHNSDSYLEFNLSPSKDYNTYQFSNYRQKICHHDWPTNITLDDSKQNSSFTLSATIQIPQSCELFFQNDHSTINAGISAIVKCDDTTTLYYALTHSDNLKADFHSPDSFTFVSVNESKE